MRFRKALCSLFCLCVAFSGLAAEPAKTSPLGVRQQRVKRMMQTLDRKFQDLAQKLQEKEPEQAELLIKAFQQSQERLIEGRMSEISKLLDTANLSEADSKQNEVLLELDDLLRVLLDQSKDWDKVNKEIDRLEQMRESVQDLLKKQRDHLRETDRLANKDRTLQDMDEQIAEMEELLEQQNDLKKQTNDLAKRDGKKADPKEFDELANKQSELQKKTADLASKVGKPSDGSESDQNPDANQSPSDKPQEGKGNGNGSPSAESKSGTGQCKACLGKASQSQKSAAQKLDKQLPKDAQQDEQKAIEDLKKAVEALKEERKRIARLPQEMLDQMAAKQDSTNADAKKLLDEMKESPDSKSKSGPKGQKNVEDAQKSMKGASESLRGEDIEAAAEDQEKAVEELKKALDEIEQRLAQLREDTLIDRLARLEARFREMLDRQKEVTTATVALHARREERGKLARADRLKLRKLVAEEKALAEEAYQTIDILVEDGTSVVFPRVVTNLQADFVRISELLDEQQTGDFTQSLQQETEVTLQELIDALRRNLKKKKGGGGGGSCDCEPPLLPGSAELKLLRSMQVRVNRRTTAFDKLELDAELEAMRAKEAKTLTDLQEEVAEMTLELAEKY